MKIINSNCQKIQNQLKIHFGPSPQSVPLNQRINNRGIMEWCHRAVLMGGANDDQSWKEISKFQTRAHFGEVKHNAEQTKWEGKKLTKKEANLRD